MQKVQIVKDFELEIKVKDTIIMQKEQKRQELRKALLRVLKLFEYPRLVQQVSLQIRREKLDGHKQFLSCIQEYAPDPTKSESPCTNKHEVRIDI